MPKQGRIQGAGIHPYECWPKVRPGRESGKIYSGTGGAGPDLLPLESGTDTAWAVRLSVFLLYLFGRKIQVEGRQASSRADRISWTEPSMESPAELTVTSAQR